MNQSGQRITLMRITAETEPGKQISGEMNLTCNRSHPHNNAIHSVICEVRNTTCVLMWKNTFVIALI